MQLSLPQLREILGREPLIFDYDTSWYRGKNVLITGGNGSNGTALRAALLPLAGRVFSYDLPSHDVNDYNHLARCIDQLRPAIVFHLAADKHAINGEDFPLQTSVTNILGTGNLCQLLENQDEIRLVVASTCKAAQPETCYGASKLIAERMALNIKQRVVRYYNIADSSDNVFETWTGAEASGLDIEYTNCVRRFISMSEAVSLAMAAGTLPTGRYAVAGTQERNMGALASWWAREATTSISTSMMHPRRGDRTVEPEAGIHECIDETQVKGICKIYNYHDYPENTVSSADRMDRGTVRT